jgi:hypothetical protein
MSRVGKFRISNHLLFSSDGNFLLGFMRVLSLHGDSQTTDVTAEWEGFRELEQEGCLVPLYELVLTRSPCGIALAATQRPQHRFEKLVQKTVFNPRTGFNEMVLGLVEYDGENLCSEA